MLANHREVRTMQAVAIAPADAADLVRNAAALIFDVDGTLAETEELHRRAFNHAFARHGLGWHWDRAAYKDLLRVTGGKERIRAFHDRQWIAPPLSDADIAGLHRTKTAHYAELVACSTICAIGLDW
jgi:beta-phosphoglucomutase-like phosphatase (HAD superfamily)